MSAVDRSSLRHRVADDLRARISAGEMQPGERLPSEPDLARLHGVSRASIRGAIAMLEEDGFVNRRRGSGTYVTSRPVLRNDLGRNSGVSSLIASMGLEPGTVEEEFALEPAPPDVAEMLGLAPLEPCNVLRRVRTASGRRVVDSIDWCRADDLPPDELAALGERSIYAALAERGLAVHHGVASLRPDMAEGGVARRLDVPRGALLVTMLQVDETAEGRVVLVSREQYLADAFELTVYRRGPLTEEEER